LKVVDWKFTPFVKTTFTDSFARKGVLEATIENESDGTRFVLVGTHTLPWTRTTAPRPTRPR